MDCAEGMLKHVLSHALSVLPDDLAFFDSCCSKSLPGFSHGGGGLIERLKAVVATPFVRMSYTDAIDKLQASGHKFE